MKEFMQKIPTWVRIMVGAVLFVGFLSALQAGETRTYFLVALLAAWIALCLTIKCKPENQTQPFMRTDPSAPAFRQPMPGGSPQPSDPQAPAPVPQKTSKKGIILAVILGLFLIGSLPGKTRERPDPAESSHEMTYSEALAAYNRYKDQEDLNIYEDASFIKATSVLLELPVEEVSALKYAFEQVGQNVGAGFDGMRHLKKQLDKIYAGDEELLKTFRRYGVQPYDENGAERYLVDVFYDAIDMLSEME